MKKTDLTGIKRDGYKLRDLEKTLHSKKLLEKLFSDVYTKEYLQRFYDECLNA